MSGKNWAVAAAMILVLIVGVQQVGYWTHVDAVHKTIVAQLMVYQQSGLDAYRNRVVEKLRTLQMDVEADDLEIVEDNDADELRVEYHYAWPMHVLVFSVDTEPVVLAKATILGI